MFVTILHTKNLGNHTFGRWPRKVLDLIGYRVLKSRNMDLRLHHAALVPLTMPHAIPALTDSEARALCLEHRVWLVRWEVDFDMPEPSEWWHVVKDQPECLSHLGKKTRNQVRRGLKQFVVNPVTKEVIIEEGYRVYCKAYDRYATFETMLSEPDFENAIHELPSCTEFWGVRDRTDGRLVAFSENIVRDNACFYNSIWFEPEALKAYSGYALFYEMNRHYLNDRKMLYVSDGARSISHQTEVHEFLERKFGFRKVYARLKIQYFPGIGLVVKALCPLRRLFKRFPNVMFFQQAFVLLEQERIRRACKCPVAKE